MPAPHSGGAHLTHGKGRRPPTTGEQRPLGVVKSDSLPSPRRSSWFGAGRRSSWEAILGALTTKSLSLRHSTERTTDALRTTARRPSSTHRYPTGYRRSLAPLLGYSPSVVSGVSAITGATA